MVYLLAAVIVLQWLVVGGLLFDARRERQAQARVLAEFNREAWAREERLAQRLQAPQVAVRDYSDASLEPAEEQPWMGWDEDPADRLTREQLAELE